MKTLKKSGAFKRVSDNNRKDLDKIAILIKEGWNYCPKSEWKESNNKESKKESNKESKKKSKKDDGNVSVPA
jgi:hypothetical protein